MVILFIFLHFVNKQKKHQKLAFQQYTVYRAQKTLILACAYVAFFQVYDIILIQINKYHARRPSIVDDTLHTYLISGIIGNTFGGGYNIICYNPLFNSPRTQQNYL